MPDVLTDVSQRQYREATCAHCGQVFLTFVSTNTLCKPCWHMGHRGNPETCYKCEASRKIK